MNDLDQDRMEKDIGFAILTLIVIILLSLLTSCAPRVIEKIHYQHDTTYVERIQIDSVFKRDSIYIMDHGDKGYED